MTPTRAYLALGSNLGDRGGYLALARTRLAALPDTGLVAASTVEETEPLEGSPAPRYLNQMVAVDTALSPRDLLRACHDIEREAGRVRRSRWEARTLDIDIVRYDDLELEEPDLVLPHPGLRDREFWCRELAELRSLGY